MVGSGNYMSPEQARGEALDARSDIDSQGITLFFLIEGKPPFQRKTLVETLAAHLNEPVPRLKHPISEELRAVVVRCLAKEVQDRFADVHELRPALRECTSVSNA